MIRTIPLTLSSYIVASTILSVLILSSIYKEEDSDFYSTTVRVVTGKGTNLLLGNQAAAVILSVSMALSKLLFGKLRESESEHLCEEIPATVMETLFVMTIFRTQFTSRIVMLFLVMLSVKAFHWLLEKRVDYMEQAPIVSVFGYLRILMTLSFLFAVDVALLYLAAASLWHDGPSMMLLFALEYTLLLFSAFASGIKFALNAFFIYQGNWARKGIFAMYLELVGSMLALLVYAAFFFAIMRFYGLPLHLIRQMYNTVRSVQRSFANLFEYRQALERLRRFPDATAEEMANTICVMCRAEMSEAKRLPQCGHVFHFECLREWLKHRQVCPMCTIPIQHQPAQQQQQANVEQQQPQANVAHRQQEQEQEQEQQVNVNVNVEHVDIRESIRVLQQQMMQMQETLNRLAQAVEQH
jgi:E3 ubiquitin-protein ligase synoviolin